LRRIPGRWHFIILLEVRGRVIFLNFLLSSTRHLLTKRFKFRRFALENDWLRCRRGVERSIAR
jgi:hypothetical protein